MDCLDWVSLEELQLHSTRPAGASPMQRLTAATSSTSGGCGPIVPRGTAWAAHGLRLVRAAGRRVTHARPTGQAPSGRAAKPADRQQKKLEPTPQKLSAVAGVDALANAEGVRTAFGANQKRDVIAFEGQTSDRVWCTGWTRVCCALTQPAITAIGSGHSHHRISMRYDRTPGRGTVLSGVRYVSISQPALSNNICN